jgi:hypothetical protein
MNELIPELPQELQRALDEYYSLPVPTAEFASRLEAQLRLKVEPSRGSQQLTKKMSNMKLIRTRLLVVVLIALLILLALSGVVYALSKALGYIPGLGVVDQNTPFHVLAEPVSQTRDGVTVTVEKAIMNADDVLIAVKVEGLSPDKFSFLEPLNTCMRQEELHFPNGEFVHPNGGVSSMPINTGFESTNKYGPIPVGTTEATLFIPCIPGALSPGILPENWELPLHFIPAPQDLALTIMPVTEIAPSSNAPIMTATSNSEATPSSTATDAGNANPVTLTQVIDAGDSYILVGEDHPPALSQPGAIQLIDWNLTDGNGLRLDYQIPDIDIGGKNMLNDKNMWVVQFAKGFTPPVHITHRYRYAFPADSQDTYVFEFDAGANPQQSQVWNMNQEFQLAGHTVRLNTITAENMPIPLDGSPSKYAYYFDFQTNDPAVNSFSVNIDGYTPNVGDPRNNHPNNYAEGDPLAGKYWNYVSWPNIPTGKLKVVFSNLYLNGELKSWTLDWQP